MYKFKQKRLGKIITRKHTDKDAFLLDLPFISLFRKTKICPEFPEPSIFSEG